MEERMNCSNCPKRKPFATLAFISALLDTGISPNTVLTNEHGSNTLFGMCFEKLIPTDPALIGLMLKRGDDPNQRLGRGEVPLSIAAAEPDVFLALLDGGAAPNLIMEIPMLRVSESREPKVEQYALKEPLIHRVASTGAPECLAMLMARGVKHDGVDPDGFTPLLRAIADGNVRTTELLLERGAQLDVTNRFGERAVALAARVYDVSRVRRLDRSGEYAKWLAEFPVQTNSPLVGTWIAETNRTSLHLTLRRDGGGEVDFYGTKPLGWKTNGNDFQVIVALPRSSIERNNLKETIYGNIRFDAGKNTLAVSWQVGNGDDLAFTMARAKTTPATPARK